MLQSLLSEIGLSDKEQAIYYAMLSCGLRPTSFLARRAALNRGTAYVALHSLLRKGLVTKTVRRKVQYFGIKDPRALVNYVSSNIASLQERHERIKLEVESLRSMLKPAGAAPAFELFEGTEGARAALDDTLTTEDGILRAFLSLSDIQEFLGHQWFNQYTLKRIKKKIPLRAIRTREKDREARRVNALAKKYVNKRADLREIRHVSEDLAFPVSMYIYDDKIAIISSKQENFAVIIRSQEFSQMQRKLFDLFWALGK